MLNIYLYKHKKDIPNSFLVSLFLVEEDEYGPLFQKVSAIPFKNMVKFVNLPEEANYMLLPHTFSVLEKTGKEYIREAEAFADSHNLKTIIFAYGDSHSEVVFKNSIVLRTAKYKSNLKSNEIIIPPFVEDLGSQYGVDFIKKENLPVVGFAGMTNMPTKKEEIKYQIKIFINRIGEIVRSKKKYQRQGLYFRRKVLNILSKSKSCDLLTHKRKSFSAAMSTIQGSPEQVRQEFVDLIKSSHLPLVIRGNGNYSLRFFEVLSLGRVPLFIDTDTPLPYENKIDYDSFMLRVDYKDIPFLQEKISEFWELTSEEKFLDMQKKARSTFENILSAEKFYKDFFQNLTSRDSENQAK